MKSKLNYFAKSGAALADLVMAGFVARVSEELSTPVARAQKAQGEAEEAAAAAQAKRGAEEVKIIELHKKVTSLAEQVRDYEARLEPLKKQYREFTVMVEGLRAEAKQHARKSLDIIAHDDGA